MKRMIALLVAVVFSAVGSAYALYGVTEQGTWPKSWPKELEPLRKQSRTLVGPEALNRHYAIRFAKRDDLESAWPHILKVKSKGAPVILRRAPNFFLGGNTKAGVVVHCPPLGQADDPAHPEATFLELVVDGDVVDLNRLPLPADTPIMDERFKDRKSN